MPEVSTNALSTYWGSLRYEVSASTEAKRSLTLNLEKGDEKYIRLEIKMGLLAGHVKPVLVDTEVGKEEIKKTKYIGVVE